MLENINLFCHSSIKITGSKTIYIDPYKIEEEFHDADFVLCTHTHFDHYSVEDIEKVSKKGTIIIAPSNEQGIIKVVPNVKYEIEGLKFKTTYAYNVDKDFHPKANNWVGYIVELDEKKYYVAGDTDNVPEIQGIECDIAFIPVGGTYTMNKEEAADLAKTLKAKIIVPTHYGLIVGEKTDGENFAKSIKNKKVEILI